MTGHLTGWKAMALQESQCEQSRAYTSVSGQNRTDAQDGQTGTNYSSLRPVMASAAAGPLIVLLQAIVLRISLLNLIFSQAEAYAESAYVFQVA